MKSLMNDTMEERKDGQADREASGRTERRADGRTNERPDGRTSLTTKSLIQTRSLIIPEYNNLWYYFLALKTIPSKRHIIS